MRRWCAEIGRNALALGLIALGTMAEAQQPAVPPPAGGAGPVLALPPGTAAPSLPARSPGGATPSLTNPNLPPVSAPRESTLTLGAVFAGGRPIRSGLVWRIYEDRAQGGDLTVVARSDAANPNFSLTPGAYVADVTYGFASTLKHIVVPADGLSDQLTVTAGALSLGGAVAQSPIPADRLSFAVYVPVGNDVEGRLIRNGIKAGELVRLPEGTYHVVSTYGDSNAIQSADLKVENAKVTQATMNHRAATVTLKLVEAPGTEAFAGTAFSVLTPGGDTIREAIGAFPSVTLAEGDYVVIARHDGQVYTRDFKVESGMDRDIEVVAKGS